MSTAHRLTRPPRAQSVWLVAEREIGSKLRSKAFLISTIILFLGALALVVWGGIQAGSTSGTPVAVTADAAAVRAGRAGPRGDGCRGPRRGGGPRRVGRRRRGDRRRLLVAARLRGHRRLERADAADAARSRRCRPVELLNPDDATRPCATSSRSASASCSCSRRRCSAARSRRASSRRSRRASSSCSSRRSRCGRCWPAR